MLRSSGCVSSTSIQLQKQRWTPEELKLRNELLNAFDRLTEDQFTELILVPLFGRLGFTRISVSGHRDKSLEFGNDLWMKIALPTNHLLYFAAQVKVGKIDSAGSSKNTNIAGVLNQVQMLLGLEILDPDLNKKVLLDHVFVISSGEITKPARLWLGNHLDHHSRRHIIFMDRDEVVSLCIRTQLRPPSIAETQNR